MTEYAWLNNIYLLIGAVATVFHKVKIKSEVNTVFKLDKQIHCIAIAAIF